MEIVKVFSDNCFVKTMIIPENLPFTVSLNGVNLIGQIDDVERALTKRGAVKHENPAGDLWIADNGEYVWIPLGGKYTFSFATYGLSCVIKANWANLNVKEYPKNYGQPFLE